MVLRRLLFTVLNNPRLIEKLSESWPIRAAAQVTASALTRAQLGGQEAARRLLREGSLARRAVRLRETFLRELKDGARAQHWPRSPGNRRGGSGRGSQ
ncbi:protein NCBP2AS2 [Emydura macquarii macquarii]|uniref:protein NCBP2AS2 n=1 Tax=Emydura macquarii macquarii TaxID=1129001 RepID=UPI003529E74C